MRFLLIFITTFLFAKNILIINSYSPALVITSEQFEGVLSVLNNRNDITKYIEFMDTKQFPPTKEYFFNYYEFLKNKYYHKKIDIVVTTDDNALNFVKEYKDTPLFKDAKVFFSGVNNLSLANVLDKNFYAGVFEKKEPVSNYYFAKKIRKNLKTIYVLTDGSTSGTAVMKEYKNRLKKIEDVKFVYLNYQNLEDILKVLKKAHQNSSAIFYLTPFSFKLNGKHIDYKRVTQLISNTFHIPLIVHIDFLAKIENSNIVGGKVTDYFYQGKIAGEKVLQYLDGMPMNLIGFTFEKANKMYLNVKNLERFGVNAYELGYRDAVYVNKDVSFFEMYKGYIIGFFLLLVVIVVFSIILGIKNRELYSLNKEILELNKNLEDKIKERVEEIRKKDEMLVNQGKLAMLGQMLGAIAHQWRQPLNSLAINIQMLPLEMEEICDKFDEEKINKFVEDNMKTIKFMSYTIDNFKDFFKQDKKITKFSVKKAVEDTYNLIKPQIKNNGIDVTISGDDFEVEGLENEFRQVILNILLNAKDALMDSGVENKKIEIELKDNKVIIRDNAGGIDEDVIDNIFDAYFTTKDYGTGIGLYISKLILEHFNAHLSAENGEEGAEFVISF